MYGAAAEIAMGYDPSTAGALAAASARGLAAARRTVTQSQHAALIGQTVHGDIGRIVARQWILPAVQRRGRARMAMLGSGLGLWALSTAWELAAAPSAPALEYSIHAEIDERAADAHRALWAALGATPTNVGPAHTQEAVALVQAAAADVVLVSLCCSPFSPANRRRSEASVEDALREMAGALRAAVAGQPAAIVFENSGALATTAGEEIRRRIEVLLTAAASYDWQWAMTCPSMHAGVAVHRERVFFAGIRRHD